jgi:hypothetical protein
MQLKKLINALPYLLLTNASILMLISDYSWHFEAILRHLL